MFSQAPRLARAYFAFQTVVAAAPELVTTGPYACVRNPMAVAGILQGVAIGMVFGFLGWPSHTRSPA